MYPEAIVDVIRQLFARTDQGAGGDLSATDFLEEVGLLLNPVLPPPTLRPWSYQDTRKIELTEVEAESLIQSGLVERCDGDYCGANVLHPKSNHYHEDGSFKPPLTFDLVEEKLAELRAAVEGQG